MATHSIVHLVCTAHIDPVWMWSWEEGAREAISTFRTAVDLLDSFPEFIFNHNESLLYEWVEDYDPPLFSRIQELVRAGRWHITGGWYLQPDVNMPGGETLIRVIAEGRRYFAEKFGGVRPTVAYNFDSFGHPGSLPQLLLGSGFELYIHCRPNQGQMDLPEPLYRWHGVDGSEILAIRPDSGWYCTPGSGQAQAQAREGIRLARERGEDILVLWGLGDHGGGATRADLEQFRTMIAETTDGDIALRHSTPEAYLERIKAVGRVRPVQSGELQRTLAGTYTSVAPIKRSMRETEALLASAERWAAIAWWRYGWAYPAEKLRDAWKQLMLNTFHDVLCGSLLESAIPGVMDKYGFARDTARRIIARTQYALLPNRPPTPGTIPIYVLNPHSSPMKAAIACNFLRSYSQIAPDDPFGVYDDHGVRIPHQEIGGTSIILDEGTWQPFAGFVADVPPLSARRYEIRVETEGRQTAAAEPPPGGPSIETTDGGLTIQNQWWTARFSAEVAAPISLIDRASGRDILKGPLQLVAMQDFAHAWGGEYNATFNVPYSPFTALSAAEVGNFTGMEGKTGPALRLIASGPVWTTVECLVGWQHTRAALRFTFYAALPQIDVDVRLYMAARLKMIKLVLPLNLGNASTVRTVCEVPYGDAVRVMDGLENPYTRWLRLESDTVTVGIANNGQSGFDVSADGLVGLSLSRGAVHCSWIEEAGLDPAKSYTYMDQGQIDTRFRLLANSDRTQLAGDLLIGALELNQPLERFYAYHPTTAPAGASADPAPFLSVEPATVVLGALKKADTGEALIIRLVETAGQAVTATVRFDGNEARTIAFEPYQIRTFRVSHAAGRRLWAACNLIEEVPISQ